MVVVHGVAGKVASIAQRSESLFRNFVFPLRRLGNDVSRHEVVIVEVLGKRIFGVPECFLIGKFELSISEKSFFLALLTFPGSLTQIVLQPMGASIELLLSTVLGRISSM